MAKMTQTQTKPQPQPQPCETPISPHPQHNKSHKQRRGSPTGSPAENEFRLNSARKTVVASIPASLPAEMASTTRLLVCSIGNPGPYINTFHSAGHSVLTSLANALSYPSFQRSRTYGNGLLSVGEEFTLWQSSSLMNISGVGIAAAWRQFLKDASGHQVKLVVVHDELELALGQVKVKRGDASAKGHNGLKSIKEVLRGVEFTRIGVGIGRPESRESDVVAAYVLKKMSGDEKARVERCVGPVETELRKLAGS